MNRFYDTLILDVDGVLLDSNSLKAENIRRAAASHADPSKIDEFVQYFVGHNGVPREGKIEFFFGKGTDATQRILVDYNELNKSRLADVELTAGVKTFLANWSGHCPIYALSGGTQHEVKTILELKGISQSFSKILGGPVGKSEHLEHLALEGATLFVGDSRHDAEVAERFDFDFVFMRGYSQFNDWEKYFDSRNPEAIIDNFAKWPDQLQPSSRNR